MSAKYYKDIFEKWKIVLIIFPLFCVLCSIIFLNIVPYKYKVSLLVTAVSSSGKSNSSLGSLAGMAGISLPLGGESAFYELYLRSLQSRDIADMVVKDEVLLRKLYSSYWDEEKRAWVAPTGFAVVLKGIFRAIVGSPNTPWAPPNGGDLHELLVKKLKVSKDRESPLVTVSIEHVKPEVGKELLMALHKAADEKIKKQALKRTSEYIAYLEGRLQTMFVEDYRRSIIELIADQEKQRMVASSSTPIAAEVFAGPLVSNRPSSPQPVLVIGLSLILGIFIAIGVVMLGEAMREEKPE